MVKIRNLELNIEKEIGYYLFENKKFKTIEEVVIYYYQNRGEIFLDYFLIIL